MSLRDDGGESRENPDAPPDETERGEKREVGPEELEPIPEHDKGEITEEAVEEAEEERQKDEESRDPGDEER